MAAKPPPVHLLDASRPGRRGVRVFVVCGQLVPFRQATNMGWKVTCDVCNPPVRRKVRIKPRPVAPKMDLENA